VNEITDWTFDTNIDFTKSEFHSADTTFLIKPNATDIINEPIIENKNGLSNGAIAGIITAIIIFLIILSVIIFILILRRRSRTQMESTQPTTTELDLNPTAINVFRDQKLGNEVFKGKYAGKEIALKRIIGTRIIEEEIYKYLLFICSSPKIY